MSDDRGLELAEALVALLKAADPAICGGRIFDAVPPGTDLDANAFPYIEIGEVQQLTDPTTTDAGGSDSGVEEYVTLHVWSRHRGKAEARGVITQLNGLLDGAALNVVGRSSAFCWADQTRIFLDQDGLTRHGVLTVKIIHRSN